MMLAVVKEHPGPGFAIKEVPVPEPRPGWVRIRVRATGICGSDLPIFSGLREVRTPLIPGHEVAGEVDLLGDGVGGWRAGDRVAVNMVISCGSCAFCSAGRPSLCGELQELGIHTDGGFAEYTVVPARNLRRIAPSLSFEEATAVDPLACAYHGLRSVAVQASDRVAIFGVGVIGLYAVQLARLHGPARVVAVGRRDAPLALARELGADGTVNASREDPAAAIHRMIGGATVVVEATGNPRVLHEVIEAASQGARVLILGIFHELAPVRPWWIVRRELRIFGSLCYSGDEYEAAMDLMATRQIRPLVSHVVPLAEFARGIELIRRRETVKVVVQP